MKIKIEKQLTQTECGLCCVSMLASYHGYIQPLSAYREMIRVGRDGISMKQMTEIFDTIGIISNIKKSKTELLITEPTPCILFVENNHFIILERYNKKRKVFHVIDPKSGREKIPYKKMAEIFSGYLLWTEKSENFTTFKQKSHDWKYFISTLKESKYTFVKVLIITFLMYIFTLGIPIFLRSVIDTVYSNQSLSNQAIVMIISSLIIIFIILQILNNHNIIKLELKIDKLLNHKVMSHLLNIPYEFFDSRATGDVVLRLNLLNRIRVLLSNSVISIIVDAGASIVILAYMLYEFQVVALINLLFIIIIFVYIRIVNNKILEINQFELSELTSVSSIQTETVMSIFSIKCMGLEHQFLDNFKIEFEKYQNIFKKRELISKYNQSMLSFFQMFLPFILTLLVLVFSNSLGFSIGTIFLYYSLNTTVFSRSISFFQQITSLTIMKNTLARINDILEEKEEDKNLDGIIIDDIKSITFSNVCFKYSSISKNVLKELNFQIESGQKVAFVGVSGVGKSTLLKLLIGLYSPTSGTIMINNYNCKNLNKVELNRLYGIVPQDLVIFNKSIKENITLGNPNITDKDVIEALKLSNIYNEVMSMPMKLNTIISEQGKNISGGQKQRLALARALVNKPDVLILDEATSFLDSENETNIHNVLKQIGCSQVIIAHRLSTIINADKIYLLENGEILEQGTHEDLMALNGKYYDLFVKQNGS